MNFKYYDLVNFLVTGAVVLGLLYWCGLQLPFPAEGAVAASAYLLYSYATGCLTGALASWLQSFYDRPFRGDAAEVLLDPKKKAEDGSTGFGHIRFYDTERAVTLLKAEQPSEHEPTRYELFLRAKRVATATEGERLYEFNAQFGFARSLLTVLLFALPLQVLTHHCSCCTFLLNLLLIVLCWYRYRQRDFYYCKEVLDIYLRKRGQKDGGADVATKKT